MLPPHRGPRRRPPAARTHWALAVLAMLRERSMHPYEMQRIMHQRHTDDLLALKRGSLYHAINQLQRDGLIEPVETTREGRRPERTIYRITPDGEDELVVWMRDLLSVPVQEPSQFTAALAFAVQLDPADAVEQLALRTVSLQASVAAIRAIERGITALVGRASVLELEYRRALAEAELAWIKSIITELQSGKLTWNFNEIKSRLIVYNTDIELIEGKA
jgi:DNA-binding PadR family transcriptional regulator